MATVPLNDNADKAAAITVEFVQDQPPIEGSGLAPKDGDTPVLTPKAGDTPVAPVEAATTAGQRTTAFGQGTVSGVVQGGTATGGAFIGASTGAAIGAFGGPFAPITVPVGAVIGGITGLLIGADAGEEVNSLLAKVNTPSGNPLTFANENAVPPSLRPYFVAGNAFGGAAAMASAPFALALQGIRFVPNLFGRIMNGMINGAATRPASFALSELSMAFGAGVGGGAAEATFPGSSGARLTGEMIGGTLNVGHIAVQSSRFALDRVARIVASFSSSKTAAESMTVQTLRDVFASTGENVDDVIAALRDPNLMAGLDLTAGQRTGSETLLALEARLAQDSATFGREAEQRVRDAMTSLRNSIDLMQGSGNPALVREAERARATYIQALIGAQVERARIEVLSSVQSLDPSSARSLIDYGRNVERILDNALKEARAVERTLWGAVDLSGEAVPESVLAVAASIRSGMPQEVRLPGILEPLLARWQATVNLNASDPSQVVDVVDNTGAFEAGLRRQLDEFFGKGAAERPQFITANEIKIFRQHLLELSREAAARNEWNDARIYGQLAEAALDDLDNAVSVDTVALQTAREWSRSLHDAFTRTFAGESMNVRASGADRIPPEIVMRRAFSDGIPEITINRFDELQRAAQLGDISRDQLIALGRLATDAGRATDEYAAQMLEAQDQTLRFLASQIIDFTTGRVNANSLNAFMARHGELLDRFPAIRDNVQTALDAENFLVRTAGREARIQRLLREDSILATVLNTENPAQVISETLKSGRFPVRDLTIMARDASRHSPEAVEGLRRAMIQFLMDDALSPSAGAIESTGSVFDKLRATFGRAVRPGGPTLSEVLVRSRIMTRAEVDQFQTFLDQAASLEIAAMAHKPTGVPIGGTIGILQDFAARYSAVNLAAHAPGQGNSLMVAHLFSRATRQILDRIPANKARQVLEEVLVNPEAMALLLERIPANSKRGVGMALQFRAYMWNAGIMGWMDEPESE